MAIDAVRSYLQLATGLTDVTKQKAKQAAAALLASSDSLRDVAGAPEAALKMVNDIAEEIIATSRNNRDLITAVVRSEVERFIDRLGVANRDDLEAVDARLKRLDARIDELASAAARSGPAKKSPTKRAPAKKVPATETPATQAPAEDLA